MIPKDGGDFTSLPGVVQHKECKTPFHRTPSERSSALRRLRRTHARIQKELAPRKGEDRGQVCRIHRQPERSDFAPERPPMRFPDLHAADEGGHGHEVSIASRVIQSDGAAPTGGWSTKSIGGM